MPDLIPFTTIRLATELDRTAHHYTVGHTPCVQMRKQFFDQVKDRMIKAGGWDFMEINPGTICAYWEAKRRGTSVKICAVVNILVLP
jgi:hypothetical protein